MASIGIGNHRDLTVAARDRESPPRFYESSTALDDRASWCEYRRTIRWCGLASRLERQVLVFETVEAPYVAKSGAGSLFGQGSQPVFVRTLMDAEILWMRTF